MTTHATIDIETIDTCPEATVLSIGCVKFNPLDNSEPHSELYFKVSIDDQDRLGRTASDDTIEWWSKQNKHALKQLMVDTMPFEKAINEFREWYGDKSIPIWGNSAGFDVQILESAMYSIGYEKPPWKYWHIHCFKTATNLVGVSNSKIRATEDDTHHNALDDAISQTNTLVKILRT